MDVVGGMASMANMAVAVLRDAHGDGNADMRSVWQCSRNDALEIVAVMFAALGVFAAASAVPELFVSGLVASLAIVSGPATVREARVELPCDRGEPNSAPVTAVSPPVGIAPAKFAARTSKVSQVIPRLASPIVSPSGAHERHSARSGARARAVTRVRRRYLQLPDRENGGSA